MKIRIKQVDAFTRTPNTGNPAGVIVDAKDLTEQQMQTIAREINLSETAFVLPPTSAAAHLRIRWFTPTTEVPLCGHATVATFHVLAEECRLGMDTPGSYEFLIETMSGMLPVTVRKEPDALMVMVGMKLPSFVTAYEYRVEMVKMLNITRSEIHTKFPVLRNNYLYVPVKRLHTLFAMQPNFLMLSHFLGTRKFGGICAYTTETVERNSVVHSRFFAPHEGIPEDPATGSAHGSLGVLLHKFGVIKMQDGLCVVQAEQGDVIKRRGRITIELNIENGQPQSVRVGGSAVTVMEGELLLGD